MAYSDAEHLNSNATGELSSYRPSTFDAYDQAGFRDDLLPILPHDAVIHPDSPAREDLQKSKGKVPGRKLRGGWMGFAKWTEHRANADDLHQWQGWGAGIGLQGRNFPALDIDVDDPELADKIEQLAIDTFGDAPVRFGRGEHRILVYSGSGFAKRRLAFGRPCDVSDDQSLIADPETTTAALEALDMESEGRRTPLQAVEFLATGQQYVVEGIHPKTGQAYSWRGRSLVDWGAAGLTLISSEQLHAFYQRVETLIDLFGYEIKKKDGEGRNGLIGQAGVWQDGLLAPSLAAVERALAHVPNEADYDEWINVMVAVKASTGGSAEGFELFADWSAKSGLDVPETTAMKYDSFRAPYMMGWPWLARYCDERSNGKFNSAFEDFDAVEDHAPDGAGPRQEGPVLPKAEQAMFDRYVWVEAQKRACDRMTGKMLDREQFNIRNAHIGHPADKKDCAWGVFTSQPRHLQAVGAVTYRPGGDEFVVENLPGLTGRCINVWKPVAHDLPETADDSQIQPWLDHLAFVLPVERERNIVLDWLAWIIQNPGEKPNWCLVIGSTFEGLGKDLMLEPVRIALGAANVREITAEDLNSNETDYLDRTRLLLVEEMQMSERKAMENKLKPIIAAPPYTLRVNIKYVPRYEIPNLIAAIFFTNMENALAISRMGRRYFVAWNASQPKSDSYYEGLVDWYESGGGRYAARWLMDRNVSAFKAKGRAPETAAREDMRKATRSLPVELIEDGIADRHGPFEHRVFALPEVIAWLGDRIRERNGFSPKKIATLLRNAGAYHFGRMSLGEQPNGSLITVRLNKEEQVFARPDLEGASDLTNAEVSQLFWKDRSVDREDARSADEMFGSELS